MGSKIEIENNLKFDQLNDFNNRDNHSTMEGKDIQTGMKRNDYGNRRHNRNDNGTYNSSGNLRYYRNRCHQNKGSFKHSNTNVNRYQNYTGNFFSGSFNQRNSYTNCNSRGSYCNSISFRTSSQSNDIQNIKERSPRSRVNSETSQSSKDFITPLQSNNVSSYYTNMSNQIQNYKNEKKDSINILPNSTNTNFSTILNHNTDYSLPETTKFCISCNSNINIKGKIGSDKKSCICKDNERQEAKM